MSTNPGRSTQFPDEELVTDLAREAVSQGAPHELPLFRVTSRRYLENPEAVTGNAGRDEMLGFGVETVASLTPFALAVAGPVVSFLFEQVKAVAMEESEGAVRDMVRKLFKRFRTGDEPPEAVPPPLTGEQLSQVHAVALNQARQLNLPEAQADLLADSMVGSLVGA